MLVIYKINSDGKLETTSQQQLSLIATEMTQFKDSFARLQSLATDLLAQVKSTKIHQWDSGNFFYFFMLQIHLNNCINKNVKLQHLMHL